MRKESEKGKIEDGGRERKGRGIMSRRCHE